MTFLRSCTIRSASCQFRNKDLSYRYRNIYEFVISSQHNSRNKDYINSVALWKVSKTYHYLHLYLYFFHAFYHQSFVIISYFCCFLAVVIWGRAGTRRLLHLAPVQVYVCKTIIYEIHYLCDMKPSEFPSHMDWTVEDSYLLLSNSKIQNEDTTHSPSSGVLVKSKTKLSNLTNSELTLQELHSHRKSNPFSFLHQNRQPLVNPFRDISSGSSVLHTIRRTSHGKTRRLLSRRETRGKNCHTDLRVFGLNTQESTIVSSHLKNEKSFSIAYEYLKNQPDISSNMRAILVDWLVDIQCNFCFRDNTLFLAINLVDRYLSVKRCSRKNLQLVGEVAIMIASKLEESKANLPKINEYVKLSAMSYTSKEIAAMEVEILSSLLYNIFSPHPLVFLRPLLAVCDRTIQTSKKDHENLSKYLLHLSLLSSDLLHVLPSHLAAAVFHLSGRILYDGFRWNNKLALLFGNISEKNVAKLCRDIKSVIYKCVVGHLRNLSAIKRKFNTAAYGYISSKCIVKQDKI